MKREIPAPLWIGIVFLCVMIGMKMLLVFNRPAVVIDILLSVILLVGIVQGKKWAYVLAFLSVGLGTALGLLKGIEYAVLVFGIDCLVLVPVWLSTDYFFPERQSLAEEGGTQRARRTN